MGRAIWQWFSYICICGTAWNTPVLTCKRFWLVTYCFATSLQGALWAKLCFSHTHIWLHRQKLRKYLSYLSLLALHMASNTSWRGGTKKIIRHPKMKILISVLTDWVINKKTRPHILKCFYWQVLHKSKSAIMLKQPLNLIWEDDFPAPNLASSIMLRLWAEHKNQASQKWDITASMKAVRLINSKSLETHGF